MAVAASSCTGLDRCCCDIVTERPIVAKVTRTVIEVVVAAMAAASDAKLEVARACRYGE